MKAVSRIVSETTKPIDWIETELREAYKAAELAAYNTGVQADEASLQALERAEQRLSEAERRLLSWVGAPEYIAWKRALSIWVGLLAGLVVAILGDLGIMRALALPSPRLVDMLVTGLVIGAGPGPMHSLIGILQSGKDAVSNLADLAKASAVRKAVIDVRPPASDTHTDTA